MADRIYLDHAATTPMRPEAIAAVAEGMARWANPSSPHAEGRSARAALEDARGRIASALGWRGEIILTSGASEALAIALGRAKGGRRFVSPVEHDSVFRAAPDAGLLEMAGPVLDFAALDDSITGQDRPVVAVQHINSETGNDARPEIVAEYVRAAGGVFVCDCAQSAGKFELPDADLIVVSAHKLGGPAGVGALLVRDLAQIEATGGQERGYRGGTENLPGALGFAAALEVPDRLSDPVVSHPIINPISEFVNAVRNAGGEVVDAGGATSAFIGSYAMPGMSAAAQLVHFDRRGFAVSAGSACSSGSLKPSRTLRAFGVAAEVAARTIRMSVGWSTTPDDVRAFMQAWIEVAADAKARA